MNEPGLVRQKGLAPLVRMAVLSGVTASVQLYLRLGGPVDAVDSRGRTPLILAASRGRAEICRLLLDAGADPARVDLDGNDALRAAAARGHAAVTELIRSAVASVPERQPASPPGADAGPCREAGGPFRPAAVPAAETAPGKGGAAPAGDDAAPDGAGINPAGAQGTAKGASDGMPHEPGSDPVDGVDPSGWEEEVEPSLPPADPACASLADRLQQRLSRHVAVDLDATWDEVEIAIPDVRAIGRRRATPDRDEDGKLGRLVRAALADGRIPAGLLATIAPRHRDDPDLPDPDHVANLRTTLGDLGVVIDDDPFAPDLPFAPDNPLLPEAPGAPYPDGNDHLGDAAAEGLAFLALLNSRAAEPLTRYFADLPRDRLTRHDEAVLAIEIERGTRAALAAMAMSPAAVAELLSGIDAAIAGVVPVALVLEPDDRGNDDAGPDDDGAGDAIHDDAPDVPAMPPDLRIRLEGIRDLCRPLLSRPDGGIAQQLGDRLAVVGLSHAFVSRLRRAVERDPAGSGARDGMEAGLAAARRARDRLALANLKLVVWSAGKFGGLTWLDRIQEGNIGLLKAAERFEHRRGIRFSTYALWWIRQAVGRAVEDQGRMVRVPVHAQAAMRKVHRAQGRILALTGRDASMEEIADLAEVSPALVRRCLAIAEEPAFLDAGDVWPEAAGLASPGPDPEQRLALAEIRAIVREQLAGLPAREAAVIRMRFGIGDGREYTLEEIGQQAGVTRERIRQIEAKALRRLSHPARLKVLQACR